MNRPAKIRISTTKNAAVKDDEVGTQKADDQMELEPTGEMERVGTETKPTVVQTVAHFTQLGTQFGTALVNQATGQVFLSLDGFLDGAEFHYNVTHSTQQIAHPLNFKLVPAAVVAMAKLWPVLTKRVPEALKGQSLTAIQQQTVYIQNLVEAGKRATNFCTGLENQQAIAENAVVKALRQIYNTAAPIITGVPWRRLADKNLFAPLRIYGGTIWVAAGGWRSAAAQLGLGGAKPPFGCPTRCCWPSC